MWNKGQIVYTGDFVDGKKTGKGRFEFDGSHYEGDFVDGKFHGKGKYYFADSGKIYEGDFVENNTAIVETESGELKLIYV